MGPKPESRKVKNGQTIGLQARQSSVRETPREKKHPSLVTLKNTSCGACVAGQLSADTCVEEWPKLSASQEEYLEILRRAPDEFAEDGTPPKRPPKKTTQKRKKPPKREDVDWVKHRGKSI